MMSFTSFHCLRNAGLVLAAGIMLSGCATSPLSMLPESARFLIEADRRTQSAGKPAGETSISVAELIAQAREVSDKPGGSPAVQEPEVIRLGTAGEGIRPDDDDRLSELLRATGEDRYARVEMSIGSAGGREVQGVVFRTFADARRYQGMLEKAALSVSVRMDGTIQAGLVEIRLTAVRVNPDA